jgi:DNA-binding protein HU-beta
VTQRDFINRIAKSTGIPKLHVDRVLDLFLRELTKELAREGRVYIRNFGTFRTVKLKARVGRNPRTGRRIRIRASRHVRFRAGKRLRTTINRR